MAGVAVGGTLAIAFGFAIGNGAWGFRRLGHLRRHIARRLDNALRHSHVRRGIAGDLDPRRAHASSGLRRLPRFDVCLVPGLAWLIGSAPWIAVALVAWLARRRRAVVSHFPEIPGDTTPMKLTSPLVLFAVIRAVAVAISVAIAFGLNLPDADWMPVATIDAMKPSLAQSALFAEQRLAGAVIGAATAALFLLMIDNKDALVVTIIIFSALATSIRGVNYALYCAAVAAAVLIAIDLPNPSNLGDEGRRVLFTFIGVGIAVVVMFIANLLQKRLKSHPGADLSLGSTAPPSTAARRDIDRASAHRHVRTS
jgi:Fusaric acid resistance protein-like